MRRDSGVVADELSFFYCPSIASWWGKFLSARCPFPKCVSLNPWTHSSFRLSGRNTLAGWDAERCIPLFNILLKSKNVITRRVQVFFLDHNLCVHLLSFFFFFLIFMFLLYWLLLVLFFPFFFIYRKFFFAPLFSSLYLLWLLSNVLLIIAHIYIDM